MHVFILHISYCQARDNIQTTVFLKLDLLLIGIFMEIYQEQLCIPWSLYISVIESFTIHGQISRECEYYLYVIYIVSHSEYNVS